VGGGGCGFAAPTLETTILIAKKRGCEKIPISRCKYQAVPILLREPNRERKRKGEFIECNKKGKKSLKSRKGLHHFIKGRAKLKTSCGLITRKHGAAEG